MKRFLFLGILLLLAGTLSAHDLYLQPESFYLDKPKTNIVEMRLTENRFPGDTLTWRGDKTVQFKMLGPSENRNLVNLKERNPQVSFAKNGTHQIGWEGNVTYIEITPEIFNTYITIEGYKDAIKSREENQLQNSPGRERYSRFLKTYVQVGNDLTDDFQKPLGFKIEIIPQNNPAALKVGDELLVQVLYEGKPLAMNRVMATYGEYSTIPEDYAQTLETGADGMVRFKITNPGLWMIRTNRMLSVKGDEKADWESFWSNITFQVR